MALARISKFRFLIFVLILIVIANFFIIQSKKSVKDFVTQMKSVDLVKSLSLIDESAKISWEDLDFINYERTRSGPGEHGEAVEVTDPEELKKNEEWMKKEGFYVEVSNKISLTRALPDHRPEVCKTRKFHQHMPNVSVVVVFHNELISTLLRCIHSIYNRTPKSLLHEIILVNDNSTFIDLYENLHRYVETMFDKKRMKIIENQSRQGLIKARMTGAKAATGEVLVFLDSHMEVYSTWLPPLLDVLVDNPNSAAVPVVDGMDAKTFKPQHVGYGHRGVFDWNLRYQWLPLRPQDKKVLGDPFELACLTGGAYAIRREHFFHLGGYDEGMMIWNGENWELCIKLWLCSGGLYEVPCSRVVHLSKHFTAHRHDGQNIDFVARNLKRVVDVWFDDYKKYFYRNNPDRYKKVDTGDISQQLAKKESLNCKPFSYFLDRVAPDMLMRFPTEKNCFASGRIETYEKVIGDKTMCLGMKTASYSDVIGLVQCGQKYGLEFSLTLEKSIRYEDTNDQCLKSGTLQFGNCHHVGLDQYWKFDLKSRQIYSNSNKKCLQSQPKTSKITLEECDEKISLQKWKWTYENTTALENFAKTGIIYDNK